MYYEWIAALEEAAEDPNTTLVAVTGAGDFYCAGNDLSNFTSAPESGIEQLVAEAKDVILLLVLAFLFTLFLFLFNMSGHREKHVHGSCEGGLMITCMLEHTK